ncbi:PKD domain-containing protein, partial [Bacteroidota bacterium]
TFDILTDQHHNTGGLTVGTIYENTINNIINDNPDFVISLGDMLSTSTTQSGLENDYRVARDFLSELMANSPLFYAIGNHENEEGWFQYTTSPDRRIWGVNARKEYFLNPVPDAFYSGDNQNYSSLGVNGDGLRETYFSFEWGDVLFVFLDPFWNTTSKPHNATVGNDPNPSTVTNNIWNWTLGVEQYTWLHNTLSNSNKPYKFVFAHQVSGGTTTYGRSGVMAIDAGYEWGGGSNWNQPNSDWSTNRPSSAGWIHGPIHQMLVDNNVGAFFHGHDHCYVQESRDGIIYLECPQAGISSGNGFYTTTQPSITNVNAAYYDPAGTNYPNGGHIRLTVTPSQTTAEYVRTYTSGGTNGSVSHTFNIYPNTSNSSPTADAGQDQTVVDTDNNGSENVNLDGSGSSDTDGTISSYAWKENGSQIATGATPTIGFTVGTHIVELTVTDNNGASGTDDVVITIDPSNFPPTADAGADQTVADNDNSGDENVTLDGSGSSDTDGTIVSFVWSENGSQIATGVSPTVNFALGTHNITLTVEDDDNDTDTDDVTITVGPPNSPPVANAGMDQIVIDTDNSGAENVTLDGSGSSDTDGSIASYEWTENGSQIATGVSPTVSFNVGTHNIDLTVTDDDNATHTDAVTISVNEPPVADAGIDQTVTDSDNNGSESVTLDGSGSYDNDGTIASYVWTENGSQVATGVNPSVSFNIGTHNIDLTVTDDDGLSGTDVVTIIVNAPGTGGSVSLAGLWVEGLNHTIETGNDRVLVFTAHAEHFFNMSLNTVSYGGQTMTKVAERIQGTFWNSVYTAVFILGESGINAATGNTFTPTWNVTGWTSTPNSFNYSSAFFTGVDQNTYTGDDAVNGVNNQTTVSTSSLNTNAGDMVITASTCNNNGSYSLNNGFDLGIEINLTNADGICGYKSATGVSETPSVTQSTSGNHAIVGFVLNNGNQGPPNIPPVADAGSNQTVTDTDNSGDENVALDGSGSSDSDGTIASYSWSENGSQIASGVNPTVSLSVGTHNIELTVTDNNNATATDDVEIIVNPGNSPPTADAGSDQTVTDADNRGGENVTLDGSGSFDTDGTITSYVWTENGSQVATGISPTIIFTVGTHNITLTVTDDDAATSTDDVIITVEPPNSPPVANAGTDQIVSDSDNSGSENVTLDGSGSSDTDGTITSYVWSENSSQIASGVNPTVSLSVGTHNIDLTVTDDDNATNTDAVTITVNEPPVAEAGLNQTVTDSDNSGAETITLDGTGSYDNDGTISSYVWNENGSQIASGVAPNVSFNVGTHTIELLVTDNNGATGTDNVIITIDPSNFPPTADAGADQTITDTDNSGSESVTLDGSGSSDTDGTITSYAWSENGSQIATGISPSVSFTVGTHNVILTVTDDDTDTDTDEVIITIEVPNTPPIANAGTDQIVIDSDNSGAENVTLDGSGSSDTDGTISSYIWNENGSQIASGVNPTVSFAVGIHNVDLTVTDDDNDTHTDAVTITVNEPPVADAGIDQTLTDTDNNGSESVTLDGSGSYDNDGTISSYVWSENGSQIATGVNPSVSINVGTHYIDLTITDDDGLTSTDAVTIIVNAPGTGNPVALAGLWVEGLNHTVETGNDRILVFTVHAEHFFNISINTVSYGGQTMTKVTERIQGTLWNSVYTAVFVLGETGINAATGSTFTPSWNLTGWTTTPNSADYASAFFTGVDQNTLTGDNAVNGVNNQSSVSTSSLSTDDGDMVITASTCNNNGSYTLNNGFDLGIEISISNADGICGHKPATGVNETPSVTQSISGNHAIVGFVLNANQISSSPNNAQNNSNVNELPYSESNDNFSVFPNPTSGITTINYTVKQEGVISLKIYSLEGKLIRNLIEQVKSPGDHIYCWDGKSDQDIKVQSGLYFCVFNENNKQKVLKIMIN